MSRLLFRDSAVSRAAWYHLDARGAYVGKLAARVATIIVGKHKPIFNPGVDCGDNVVVTNAAHVAFSGKKVEQKHYRWHTQYMGGLKVVPVKKILAENPQRVIWKAVSGMLPKNRLRRIRMQRLRIFLDDIHPHTVVPLPRHLQLAAHERVPPDSGVTEEELRDTPGYWVDFIPQPDGTTEMVGTKQAPNGVEPPKFNKKKGLYLKGQPRDVVTLLPLEKIASLSVFADVDKIEPGAAVPASLSKKK